VERIRFKMNSGHKTLILLVLSLSYLLILPIAANAQLKPGDPDYRFLPGDQIRLTVARRPSLNQQLTVQESGVVNLPIVGDVTVANLTLREIQIKLYQALHDPYPSVSESDVVVEAVLQHAVYVTGEVKTPGRYMFAEHPNLWDAIREAGGPTGGAALDAVRIVADQSKGGESRVVNVLEALERGSVDQLPVLNDEDTVVIPGTADVYTGSFGVTVMGAVAKPGTYRLQSDKRDLMSAVLASGGFRTDASLKRLKIIRAGEDGTTTTQEVNVRNYLDKGDTSANPLLEPGDTVNVPQQSNWKANWSIILSTAAVAATILFLVRDYQRGY
jgi:polysaccharide export outer membrane protein